MEKNTNTEYYSVYYKNGGEVVSSLRYFDFLERGYFEKVKEDILYEECKFAFLRFTKKEKHLICFPTYVIKKELKYYDMITGEEVFFFESDEEVAQQDKLAFSKFKKMKRSIVIDDLKELLPADIARYVQQFEKAKRNAQKGYRKYLETKQRVKDDQSDVELYLKKYMKTK